MGSCTVTVFVSIWFEANSNAQFVCFSGLYLILHWSPPFRSTSVNICCRSHLVLFLSLISKFLNIVIQYEVLHPCSFGGPGPRCRRHHYRGSFVHYYHTGG